jgi:hypothetical protein
MPTKNRSDLKSYFVKNAIPTEGNFVDLIDSQLNQTQDGVFKPDGEALSVVAASGAQKRVLRLFASYPGTNPDWMISLNPAQDPADATTVKLGFGITDSTGRTRLFIDAATGQIGVGTNTPQVALDVSGVARASGFRGRYDLVLNDYQTANPTSNVGLMAPPLDRDAWLFHDQNDTVNNRGIYYRQIDTSVGGLPANSIGFVGGSQLRAYVNLGDGSGYFAGRLGIGTTAPEASLHVTNGSRFSGGRHYFSDSEGKARVRVGACANIAGIYSEDTQDIFVGCDPSKTLHLWQPNTVTVKDNNLTATGKVRSSKLMVINSGANPAIDFCAYEPGANDPTLRIYSADVGGWTSYLKIALKKYGTNTNSLIDRLQLTETGELTIYFDKGRWVFQDDGNLVKCRTDGTVLWSLSGNAGW